MRQRPFELHSVSTSESVKPRVKYNGPCTTNHIHIADLVAYSKNKFGYIAIRNANCSVEITFQPLWGIPSTVPYPERQGGPGHVAPRLQLYLNHLRQRTGSYYVSDFGHSPGQTLDIHVGEVFFKTVGEGQGGDVTGSLRPGYDLRQEGTTERARGGETMSVG